MTLVDAKLQSVFLADRLEEPTLHYRLAVTLKMFCLSDKAIGLDAGICPKHGWISPVGAQKIFELRVFTGSPVFRKAETF